MASNSSRAKKASNSNRAQKNTVRIVLATAATITTLLGAQTLAFAGNAQTQAQQPDMTSVTTQDQTQDLQSFFEDSQPVQSSRGNQVSSAPLQPRPRSRSSR